MRGNSVDVLDVSMQKIIGSIPDTAGVHGVALASVLGRGFISDGAANTVTIFDLTTLQTVATVPTGTEPDAIVYDPLTKRVFTANGDSNDVTAIDAVTGSVINTIKLGGKPEFAVVDGRGRIYINVEDMSQLVVIDSQNLKVVEYYNLSPNCDSPTGLAIDNEKHRLFSVCSNQAMIVVQADTGKILDTLPIGAHSDAAVFDPKTKLAFSANGDGTLTVVGASSADRYKVLQTIPTTLTARTMALNPITHKLYLAAAEVDGIDPTTTRPHIKPDSFMILTVGPNVP